MCDHPIKKIETIKIRLPKLSIKSSASKRRRIWELSRDTHCPVIGVCLPLDVLRNELTHLVVGLQVENDYDLHVGAVNLCVTKNRVSEKINDLLNKRCDLTIQRFAKVKTKIELIGLWESAKNLGQIAPAFWACLTHPQCDLAFETSLCKEMHMIQHQAGASDRIEKSRFDHLMKEHAVLTRELARIQMRCTNLLEEKAAEINQLNKQVLMLRAELIGKDVELSKQNNELSRLRGLRENLFSLDKMRARESQLLSIQENLKQENRHLRWQLNREMKRQMSSAALLSSQPNSNPVDEEGMAPEIITSVNIESKRAGGVQIDEKRVVKPKSMNGKTILCVGGRTGNLAEYRELVEQSGAHFIHHDGGIEDKPSKLDGSLAAADMVICQTGCISHNAYWRVKSYCKRFGKECVFIDTPSVTSLSRVIYLKSLALKHLEPVDAIGDKS